NLEEAILILEEALSLCPSTHIDRAKLVPYVLRALALKVYHSGALEDLDKAIYIGQKALDIARLNVHPLFNILHAVAGLLDLRHQLTHSEGRDLEEAIKLKREAVLLSPPISSDHWQSFASLANGLRMRFYWQGEISDLEEAVQLGRKAADSIPHGDYRQYIPASCLADSLSLRFAETGDFSDLAEALKWDQCALAAVSPSQAQYFDIASMAVSHLCTRFEHFGTTEDLEQAGFFHPCLPRMETGLQ
ncbi:hypothetical protein PUNSTDRAFT_61858, partial [Punctularia strigosozonata HHB-11173 SS5]|uniref:uncharacterized protein n=1 Tax=Punctularia strigosozonata (strain HHB-11173) TaxID=741275 RepID=UPI0004417BE6